MDSTKTFLNLIVSDVIKYIKFSFQDNIRELEDRGFKSKEWSVKLENINVSSINSLNPLSITFATESIVDIPDSFLNYLESINDLQDSDTIESVGREIRDMVNKDLLDRYGEGLFCYICF